MTFFILQMLEPELQRLFDLRHSEETHDHELVSAIDALEARLKREPAERGEGELWAVSQHICDLPEVDKAIRGFVEDQTGDNATMIVREVMRVLAARMLPEGFLHICHEELERGKLTSLPRKYEFAKQRGMTLDQVHDWMIQTRHAFEAAIAAAPSIQPMPGQEG